MAFYPSILYALVVSTAAFRADAQTLVTERSISQAAANTAALAALEHCRKDGFRVTVTVLHRSGQTAVVLRDDGAGLHTAENSLRKAYTSLTFRTASGEFGKRITANAQSVGMLSLDKVTTVEGALPILAGQEVVGSIGVSGAPGGDKDAVCAKAGIDRIAPGLLP